MIDVNEFHKLLGYNTKESYEKAIIELYLSESKVIVATDSLDHERFEDNNDAKKEILVQIENVIKNLMETKND